MWYTFTVRRAGLALLVVIGILGVLVVLGTAFVLIARLERQASQMRLERSRAALLARSGIEDALARLSAGQDPSLGQSRYGGEDADLSGGPLSAEEAAQESFRPGRADVETCPVPSALRPSFCALASGGPGAVNLEGRRRGWSGSLSSPQDAQYSLKIEDESAKINVNGGFLDGVDRDLDGVPDHRDPLVKAPAAPGLPLGADGIGRGWNAPLVRILDLLGAQPEVAVPGLGGLVIRNRPPGGYRNVLQVQALIGLPGTDLSPFLTVSSWTDPSVVHPVAYDVQPSRLAISDVKKDCLPLALEEAGRPPVNLNAASRPVLLALLEGIAGISWNWPQVGTLGQPAIRYKIPAATAAGIAEALLDFRNGRDPSGIFVAAGLVPGRFESWGQFERFCDALVPGVIVDASSPDATYQYWGDVGTSLCGADLLKANFNPNTRLASQFPDQILWQWIDKAGLTDWSTEGCLGPSGTFRISCVGRVLGPSGRLLAESRASVDAEVFSLVRQTSQEQFVGGRSRPQEYLSLQSLAFSPGEYPPTAGASASASWWGGPPPGRGLAAVTYPCPPSAPAAAFDGCIGLATTEIPSLPPLGALAITFLHHFDDGWEADLGFPEAPQPGYLDMDAKLQSDPAISVWPSTVGQEPNTLGPDGAQIQWNRCPAFRALGNFPPDDAWSFHGVVSYWVKACPPRPGGECSVHFSCVRFRRPAGDLVPDKLRTQVLALGSKSDGSSTHGWGVMLESRPWRADQEPDYSCERQEILNQDLVYPGMRWHLVTARFDSDEIPWSAKQDLHLAVGGAFPPGERVPVYEADLTRPVGEDLADTEEVRFLPGSHGQIPPGSDMDRTLQTANGHVLDELAILDFGEDGAAARIPSDAWHLERFCDGRYYKGSDAAFLSPRIEPLRGGPVRLLRAWWTACLPSETRQEIPFDWGEYLPGPARPRLLDPRLGEGRVGVELDLMPGGGGLSDPALGSLVQGGVVGRGLSSFRYRVRFRTELEDPAQPVLETPFLDDVTFAFQGATGPRLLSWSFP